MAKPAALKPQEQFPERTLYSYLSPECDFFEGAWALLGKTTLRTGLIEQQFQIPPQMVDAIRGNCACVFGFG
jgi:hypothetical protein